MQHLRILIACESSGRIREAFRSRGFDAVSCDLRASEDNSPHHIQDDVLNILDDDWHAVIAHPPCTRLCNTGVRWLAEKDLWDELIDDAHFFNQFLRMKCPVYAIENPRMHKYARELIGVRSTFKVQPWMFGDDVKKETHWWTRNLPPLIPTSDLDGSTAQPLIYMEPMSPFQQRNRSRTFLGMADAIGEQWGAAIRAFYR